LIKLTIKYAIFALISTIGNLSAQHLFLMLLNSIEFIKKFERINIFGLLNFNLIIRMSAIFIGTLIGLIIKYTLDKKYIFNYKTKSTSENTGKFILYSFMGIFTTLIFWASELIFDSIFTPDYAKYIGATIGLTIGYIIKYNLDICFVFCIKE